MTVVISPDLQKRSSRINGSGDVINPRTKEVISFANEEDNTIQPEPVAAQPVPVHSNKTISDQIDEAKRHLADLELQKQEEIKRMREELARLEANE